MNKRVSIRDPRPCNAIYARDPKSATNDVEHKIKQRNERSGERKREIGTMNECILTSAKSVINE